jgi:hypothetical protein
VNGWITEQQGNALLIELGGIFVLLLLIVILLVRVLLGRGR